MPAILPPTRILPILLPSRKVRRPHHPDPRLHLRRQRHRLRCAHAIYRQQPHDPPKLRRRLRRAEPHRAGRLHGPARLQAALHGIVPQEPRHQLLLLRRRRHQRQQPHRQLRLLPRPQHLPARRQPAHLQLVPAEHHGRLRRRRRQPQPARREHLCRRRAADQRQLRAGVRQRVDPRGAVARGAQRLCAEPLLGPADRVGVRGGDAALSSNGEGEGRALALPISVCGGVCGWNIRLDCSEHISYIKEWIWEKKMAFIPADIGKEDLGGMDIWRLYSCVSIFVRFMVSHFVILYVYFYNNINSLLSSFARFDTFEIM